MKNMKEYPWNMKKNHKKELIIFTCVVIVAILLLSTVIAGTSYSENLTSDLSEHLIRLHVVANSDTDEDQALKRNVRDLVISYMKNQLKDSKSIEETKQIITSNLETIEEIANQEIKRQEKSYLAKAMLGEFPFPTKEYGDVTLPAGTYQALKIVLGEGEGQNWWCVLFPPLCFVDATHGTIPESVKEELRNTLTAEEYQIITTVDNDDDIPIKVKFKLVEFFQNSSIKFSGLMKKLFD